MRAFAPGEGTGDIGVIATTELRLLPPDEWFGRVGREMVFSAFVDGGYVQFRYRPRNLAGTPNGGPNHAKLAGAGLGFTWVRGDGWSLRQTGQRHRPRQRQRPQRAPVPAGGQTIQLSGMPP